MHKKQGSLLTYILFFFLAFATMYWGRQIVMYHSGIRVWEWTNLALLLIGIPFILVQKQACLPEVWDVSVTNRQRLWKPFITGFFFAILDIVVVIVILHPQPYDSLPPFLQPFPYSIGLYISGAFEVEVFYRLIPVTIVLFIAGRFKLSEKYTATIFWVIAILTSLREPIEQFQEGALWFMVYAFISGFTMNLLQVIFYRKAGFLASVMTRLGHYFLWHILLGIYVEYFQLHG